MATSGLHCRLQKVTNLDDLSTRVLSPSSRSNCTPRSGLATKTTPGGSSGGLRKKVTFGTDAEEIACETPGAARIGSVLKKNKKLQKVFTYICAVCQWLAHDVMLGMADIVCH